MNVRAILFSCVLALAVGCAKPESPGGPQSARAGGASSGSANLAKLMKDRNLSEADVTAALKTYTPSGRKDEFLIFASGGHSGQLLVIGVPSMRILKYIAVFTPEPWQGYGTGDKGTEEVLKQGSRRGKAITWGDTHHPALSETKGEYDGEFVFINDKANPRIAVVNLKDFTTEQLVESKLIEADHGGTFVTPNTEYVIETSQYAAPLGGVYADIKEYNEKYRGAMMFWKFDRAKRRIVPDESFAIELPPYMQDLADAGKLTSDGWAFCNSINTERATGGVQEGQPALESGASQNDMDYMHIINWRKAAEVAKTKSKVIAGMRVIPLQVAIDEGLLYFVPEPKSPHGLDVTPDGEDLVVGGKLDTHATVFNFKKIQSLIEAKKFQAKDPYGVPILPFAEAIRGQVELGLGPLHTAFDGDGNAYTSLFIETKVAKWGHWEDHAVDLPEEELSLGGDVLVGRLALVRGRLRARQRGSQRLFPLIQVARVHLADALLDLRLDPPDHREIGPRGDPAEQGGRLGEAVEVVERLGLVERRVQRVAAAERVGDLREVTASRLPVLHPLARQAGVEPRAGPVWAVRKGGHQPLEACRRPRRISGSKGARARGEQLLVVHPQECQVHADLLRGHGQRLGPRASGPGGGAPGEQQEREQGQCPVDRGAQGEGEPSRQPTGSQPRPAGRTPPARVRAGRGSRPRSAEPRPAAPAPFPREEAARSPGRARPAPRPHRACGPARSAAARGVPPAPTRPRRAASPARGSPPRRRAAVLGHRGPRESAAPPRAARERPRPRGGTRSPARRAGRGPLAPARGSFDSSRSPRRETPRAPPACRRR